MPESSTQLSPDAAVAPDLAPSRLSRREWLIALAVAVIAGLVRLVFADQRGLWCDEYLTLRAAQMGWGDMVSDRLAAGHSPLYFAYARWPLLLGTEEQILRLSSVVFVSIAVMLLTGLAGCLSLRRHLPAIWVLAVFSPYWNTAGTEYRYMMALVAITAGVAWAGAAYIRCWSWRSGLVLGMLLLLACWTNGSAQYVAVGVLLFVLWEARVRAGHWGWEAACRAWPIGFCCLGSLPLLAIVQPVQMSAFVPGIRMFVTDTCAVVFGRPDLWPIAFSFPPLPVLVAEVGILLFALRNARHELLLSGNGRGWRLLAGLLAGIILCQPLATFLFGGVQGRERYIASASLPALVLLAVAWGRQRPRAAALAFRLALGAIIIAQSVGSALSRGDLHREAFEWLVANTTGKETVLLAPRAYNPFAFKYLQFPYPENVKVLDLGATPLRGEDSIEKQFRRAFGPDSRGFYFQYYPDTLGLEASMARIKEQGGVIDYRIWTFTSHMVVLALIRSPVDRGWLESLPAPRIPWGPRIP